MTHETPLTLKRSMWTDLHEKLGGISLMDHLYNRMDGMYPNRWRANFTGENAIQAWRNTWSEAFDEDSITLEEIRAGIKNCRRMFDWPPSLTEFMRACRPMLDPEVAFHEAVKGLTARRKGERGDWSHPAIYYASIAVGQHDIMNCAYATMKGRWEKALAAQLAQAEWAPIPEASIALPEPKRTELTNAEAQKAMDRLGAGDILNKSGRDHKRWAKRILDNPKNHSPLAVAMAQRAFRSEEVAA